MTRVIVTESPMQWISRAVIYFIFFMLSLLILKSEINRRKSVVFTAKWFKWFSIICIIAGTVHLILNVLEWIPISCTITSYLAVIFRVIFLISIVYYQIYKLYYCFANTQIHSDKGYPKWLFWIMYIFGIIVSILWFISIFSV